MPKRIQKEAAEVSPRQRSILDAALHCFGHYGFRRSSMEDIAREAQISRTALYQHFGSKEKLLRALSADLHERSVAAAGEAAAADVPLEERIFRVLDAKLGFFYELLLGSEHGLEILDDNNRLCGDITAESGRRYLATLTGVLRDAEARGELSLRSGLHPQAAAEFFIRCGEGQIGKRGDTPSPTEYRRRLRLVADALVVGLGRRSGRRATGA